MVVGSRRSFQFFRQNIWFLENNGALSKFIYEIFHYLISIVVHGIGTKLVSNCEQNMLFTKS